MRVLLAEPQPIFRLGMIFRLGIRRLLQGLDAAAEFLESSDLDQTRRLAKDAVLDLALVDLRLPGIAPPDGLRALLRMLPDTPVIVVSTLESRSQALEMLNLGAMGYIPRSATENEFTHMVGVVLDGGLCLPKSFPDPGDFLIGASAAPDAQADPARRMAELTKRQRDVLGLVAQGKSNMEIATALGLSDKTVRFRVSIILRTLNVHNRTQAALIAARAAGEIRTADRARGVMPDSGRRTGTPSGGTPSGGTPSGGTPSGGDAERRCDPGRWRIEAFRGHNRGRFAQLRGRARPHGSPSGRQRRGQDDHDLDAAGADHAERRPDRDPRRGHARRPPRGAAADEFLLAYVDLPKRLTVRQNLRGLRHAVRRRAAARGDRADRRGPRSEQFS